MPLSSFRGTAQLRDDVRTNEDAASRSTRQPTDAPIGQFETIETGRLNRFRLNFGSFHKALFPTAQATFFASSDRRKTPPPSDKRVWPETTKGRRTTAATPSRRTVKKGKNENWTFRTCNNGQQDREVEQLGVRKWTTRDVFEWKCLENLFIEWPL